MVQKRAIERCRDKAKPVIVATQMLESMIHNPRPTRAEASTWLTPSSTARTQSCSRQTSVGKYPVETVQTMARIIAAAEQESLRASTSSTGSRRPWAGRSPEPLPKSEPPWAPGPCRLHQQRGDARRLARYRSPIPLLAFTTEPATRAQLSLTWGVETHLVPWVDNTDDMVRQVENELLDMDYQKGDKVVIVAGSPPGTRGSTNMLRVHRMGDAISN